MNKISEEYFNVQIRPLWNRYMEIINSNIDIIDSNGLCCVIRWN